MRDEKNSRVRTPAGCWSRCGRSSSPVTENYHRRYDGLYFRLAELAEAEPRTPRSLNYGVCVYPCTPSIRSPMFDVKEEGLSAQCSVGCDLKPAPLWSKMKLKKKFKRSVLSYERLSRAQNCSGAETAVIQAGMDSGVAK